MNFLGIVSGYYTTSEQPTYTIIIDETKLKTAITTIANIYLFAEKFYNLTWTKR